MTSQHTSTTATSPYDPPQSDLLDRAGVAHGSELQMATVANNDAALLAAYRHGDDHAFSILVNRYYFLVINACRRQVAGADVDDCVQAVFIVLAQRPAAALRAPALAAWLHRVSYFVCRNARRAAKRRGVVMEHMSHHHPTQTPASSFETTIIAELDNALQRLAEKQRAAVLLHAENISPQEIAHRLGVTTDNAYKLIERGLNKLRHYLSRRGSALSGAALVTCLGTHAVYAAPPSIASASTLLALPKSAAASTLAQGACMQLSIATVKTVFLTTSLTLFLGACAVKANSEPEEKVTQQKSQPVTTVVNEESKADALLAAGRELYNKALDTEDIEERNILYEQAYKKLHEARDIYSSLVEKNPNHEHLGFKLLECNKLHYGAIKQRRFN